MAFEDCLDQINAAAGRTLDKNEQAQVKRKVEDLRKMLNATDDVMDPAQVEAVLAADADQLKARAQIAKRNAVLNTGMTRVWDGYLDRVWEDDPGEGLLAMAYGSPVDREGSKNSLQRAVSKEKEDRLAAFTSAIFRDDLADIAMSRDMDRDIWRYQFHLNDPEVSPETLAKIKSEIPEEATQLAEIYDETNESGRMALNAVGGFTPRNVNYVAKRSHDQYAISHAAGKSIPVNEVDTHFKAWAQDLTDNGFNPAKSFPDASPERYNKILRDMFEQLSKGHHLRHDDGPPISGLGYQNIGKKHARSRVLVFDDWEGEYEYFLKYSGTGSIAESIAHGLNVVGKDIGIMKHLGPNARENIEKIYTSQKNKLIARGGTKKQLDKLDKKWNDINKKLWPLLTSELGVATDETIAKWNDRARALQTVSDLGSALLSSTNDINNAAATLTYYGERGTGAFVGNTARVAGSVLTDVPLKERMKVAAESGVLLDGVVTPTFDITDPTQSGSLRKFSEFMMKIGGIRWLANKMRSSSIVAYSVRQAQYADKSFDDLPQGIQAGLRQFTISAEEWDIIRSAPTERLSTGEQSLNPERLDDLPDSAFSGDTEAAQKRSRERLKDKYKMLFHEIAHSAATSPSLATKAVLLQGTHRGEFVGEALRHGGQYKSYIVEYMRTHLLRELYGYHPDRVGLPRAFLRAFTTGRGLRTAGRGLAYLIAGGMFWGILSNTLHDIAAGRQPQIPDDFESTKRTLHNAMYRSGALGLYGDMIFGTAADHISGTEYIVGTLGGPSARRLGQLVELGLGLRKGEINAAKTFRNLYSLVPGRSLFYTKAATDYLILYRMSEMLNPGYLNRMERNLKKRSEIQYIVPPSTVIN